MTPDDIKKAFEPWRERHLRTAWKPTTSPSEESKSWFGGSPQESSTAEWPECRECNTPMQFFLQLDLSELPAEHPAHGSGAVQLFYCSTDDGMCETWEAFSGTHDCRLVGGPVSIERPGGLEPLAKKNIVGWEAFDDAPHPPEHDELGIQYDYDFNKNRVSAKSEDPPIEVADVDLDLNVAECIGEAKPGDKLGGWPFWVQGIEYPACPECDRRMELLMQIDSEDNVDHMFGDVGCGHLTQCPDHPHVLAFAWACG